MDFNSRGRVLWVGNTTLSNHCPGQVQVSLELRGRLGILQTEREPVSPLSARAVLQGPRSVLGEFSLLPPRIPSQGTGTAGESWLVPQAQHTRWPDGTKGSPVSAQEELPGRGTLSKVP